MAMSRCGAQQVRAALACPIGSESASSVGGVACPSIPTQWWCGARPL